MGKKKLGLMSSLLFKPRPSCHSSSPSLSSPWPWPSCKNPKTDSFRDAAGCDVCKTLNSAYPDSVESCFTYDSSEEYESFSAASTEDDESAATRSVVRGLRSDRLFFEPGASSSSLIPEEAKAGGGAGAVPFENSVVLAMESEDPYGDFRRSMEEMVAAQGLREWAKLEELLLWYLKVNGKKTHGFIVGAFADLLAGLSSPSRPPQGSSSSSSSSTSSSSSSSASSNSIEIEETSEDRVDD